MCSMRSIRRDASRVLLWSRKDISRFHGDIFAPKNGWFREKHKIRTIKFLFASSTLCLLLSFPHYSKCFFVVLLVALQFYYPSEKEATSYTFLSRVAGQTTRRIARELHVQSTHHQSGTIDTRESSRKFRLNHHHGTFAGTAHRAHGHQTILLQFRGSGLAQFHCRQTAQDRHWDFVVISWFFLVSN